MRFIRISLTLRMLFLGSAIGLGACSSPPEEKRSLNSVNGNTLEAGDPPTASPFVFEVAAGQTFNGMFEGDDDKTPKSSLRFKVTQAPSKGTLTIAANKINFSYRARSDSSGIDNFKIVAIDSAEQTSAPALISVNITTDSSADTTPPLLTQLGPTGTLPLGTTQTTLTVTTNESATCKYSTTANQAFSAMSLNFTSINGTTHTAPVSNLADGQTYSFYFRCRDSALNANTIDAPINFSVAADTSTPLLSNLAPSGSLPTDTANTTLSLDTNVAASCRYSTNPGVAYAQMTETFLATSDGLSHSQPISGLQNATSYIYYVRCLGLANQNANTNDALINFSVAADTTPPLLTQLGPTGTLPLGTTQTTLTVTTNESATCKYSTTANQAFSAMSLNFTSINGTTHTAPVSNLADGQTYSFYVRCRDSAGNANASDAPITFSIAEPPNTAPTAQPFSFNVKSGESFSNTLPASDTQTPSSNLSFQISSQPSKGTLTISPLGGAFTYTPNVGALGADNFSFTATDPQGLQSAPAQVSVTILPADSTDDTSIIVIVNPGSVTVIDGEGTVVSPNGGILFQPNQKYMSIVLVNNTNATIRSENFCFGGNVNIGGHEIAIDGEFNAVIRGSYGGGITLGDLLPGTASATYYFSNFHPQNPLPRFQVGLNTCGDIVNMAFEGSLPEDAEAETLPLRDRVRVAIKGMGGGGGLPLHVVPDGATYGLMMDRYYSMTPAFAGVNMDTMTSSEWSQFMNSQYLPWLRFQQATALTKTHAQLRSAAATASTIGFGFQFQDLATYNSCLSKFTQSSTNTVLFSGELGRISNGPSAGSTSLIKGTPNWIGYVIESGADFSCTPL